MGSFLRKIKRQKEEKVKAPRCCGRHMFMNKYGVWQCRKCGKTKFDIGVTPETTVTPETSDTNDTIPTGITH